jgi:dihydropteroate synthase
VGEEVLFRVKSRDHVLGRRAWIMGIVNVTPDSFSDGGLYLDPARAVEHGLALVEDGADVVDIGGESTRPGSDPVPAAEEIRRVQPVIAGLRGRTEALISVDTSKVEVAEAALDAGADIVNDISSFRLDPRILTLAAGRGAGFILMHMRGVPKTMQVRPRYRDVVAEVRDFLAERIDVAEAYGLPRASIAVDPGIGFGKTHPDNLALLASLSVLAGLGRPVLVGVSRKSFIGKIIDAPPQDRLEGTIAAAVMSLVNGAAILRVHDVRAVRRAVRVAEAIRGASAAGSPPGEEKAGYVH